jgi:hypothetical protein
MLALTRINVDSLSSDSETGSKLGATFSRHKTWTQIRKRPSRNEPTATSFPPRSALQKCIRTNGLPSLKLAGVG